MIPARGGSKGVPGKNTAPVGGIPLVARAVRACRAAPTVTDVVVSTDSPAVAAAARAAGAAVVTRPAALSGDTASSEAALLHALDSFEELHSLTVDVLLLVQCTSPFLTPSDVESVAAAVASGAADTALTAAPFHGFLWRTEPDGRGAGVNHEAAYRPRRQDRPAELLETGAAYAMDAAGFRTARHRFFGRTLPVPADPARVLEIDDPHDLARARLLAPLLDTPHAPDPLPTERRTPPVMTVATTDSRQRSFGSRIAGPGHPVYVVGEIGINHNGDLGTAFALIDAAADAGCDAVKFQKRTPEICTPRDQWDVERDTPWGRMTYIDYRHRVEFGEADYLAIDEHCARRGIAWFASPWDTEAVAFLEKFDLPAHKVASASLTDDELLRALRATGRTVVLSTGMSTPKQIRHAVEVLGSDNILLCHATSTYPAKAEELNLRVINTLQDEYPNVPIGYSGHETGLQTTLAAVALGATFVERHITLDRAMWGSDQAASVEPGGLARLVRDIRTIETALGDGVKKVYASELGPMKKLRRVQGQAPAAV
ncbi:N,N'-diacetyllegionaminic acid synthase [Streptomyces lavendulae subsp. lavendulae]|uniref:N,N'-diacetyllegionaminic acid synthase n=2 Tax=Streptomyces lavendulae TaxID=1914 RepID=A0A2K8PDR4_STRLA|nr:N,N'-diacetyllegionaminic acid synthase [Streptomyces lavendulae subsp. lavendulae]QUQ54713.1 8-amino-3,8-dideoxy-manno-octulosonate cytidylyltransferase [Streptomyces lavendulae subsp. lavendulae]